MRLPRPVRGFVVAERCGAPSAGRYGKPRPAGVRLAWDNAWRGEMSPGSVGVTRRRLLQASALSAAAAAAGTIAAPTLLRAQGAAVKLGVLHPVSGALSYSGQQGRLGATLAIEEVNAGGGIKALGGAKIEAVLGDAQS